MPLSSGVSYCGYLEGYFGGRFVTTLAVVVVSSFGQWPDHPESASSFGNFQLCNWSRLTVDRTLLLHIIELPRDLHSLTAQGLFKLTRMDRPTIVNSRALVPALLPDIWGVRQQIH